MNNYLKRYRVTLNTLLPVHIGSGEVIGKKEFIFDKKNSNIYYPDTHGMIGALKRKGLLEEYERFLLGGFGDLYTFLTSNAIPYGEWSGAPISVRGIVDYKFNVINTFVKDPYGLPYIPGSSIKGAIRNIILVHEAWRRRESGAPVDTRLNPTGSRYDMNREAARIEAELLNVLHRNKGNKFEAVNDIMAAFRFGDSDPVGREELTICRKIDGPAVALNRAPNRLSTYRECIKPGVKITLSLTVDTELLSNLSFSNVFEQKKFKMMDGTEKTMPVILAKIFNFNRIYTKDFQKYFSEIDYLEPDVLYLGGGTGFMTKTMLLGLLDNRKRLDFTSRYLSNRFRKHKHDEDKNIGVSPHTIKLTEYNGRLSEMGKCAFDVAEVQI